MTKKSMILGIVLAIISAVIAAAMTMYVARGLLMSPDEEQQTVSLSGFWSSKSEPEVEDAEIHFVDIKNIVINLSSTGRTKHYLLLDLALTTHSSDGVTRIENSIPLVKSATVNLLTNMDYHELSTMSVADLRNNLLDEYRNEYAALKLSVPFSDVMISKMVFQ